MPAVGETTIFKGKSGLAFVHTVGMKELSRELGILNASDLVDLGTLPLRYGRAIKAAAQPIADSAAQFAPNVTGDYASRFKITGGRRGAFIVNSDPGAGVIEFARSGHHGETLTSRYGRPSRSIFPAIERDIVQVAEATGLAVESAFSELTGKDYVVPD